MLVKLTSVSKWGNTDTYKQFKPLPPNLPPPPPPPPKKKKKKTAEWIYCVVQTSCVNSFQLFVIHVEDLLFPDFWLVEHFPCIYRQTVNGLASNLVHELNMGLPVPG